MSQAKAKLHKLPAPDDALYAELYRGLQINSEVLKKARPAQIAYVVQTICDEARRSGGLLDEIQRFEDRKEKRHIVVKYDQSARHWNMELEPIHTNGRALSADK